MGKLLTHVHYLHKHFLNICLGMGGVLDWFKSVFGERLQIHRIKLGFFIRFLNWILRIRYGFENVTSG